MSSSLSAAYKRQALLFCHCCPFPSVNTLYALSTRCMVCEAMCLEASEGWIKPDIHASF